MANAGELNDLLKDLDLSRADGRAGLGALLREVGERPDAGFAGIRPVPDTTVYNARAGAGLDHAGVACGD